MACCKRSRLLASRTEKKDKNNFYLYLLRGFEFWFLRSKKKNINSISSKNNFLLFFYFKKSKSLLIHINLLKNMNQKVEKIIKLHELKDELKKKNKFLDYNPITDTIIIEGRISIKCDEIFKEKFYGETIKEISHKLNKKVSATLYGFEKIKNGEVPKECEIEKLCPLFHSYETIEKINLIFNTEMHNQFKENSIDKEIIERYSLNIFLNPFHQKIGLLFSYDIDGIIFPLTLAQFKKMKINETDFIQETLKNSQEKMEEEIKNFSKENGFFK